RPMQSTERSARTTNEAIEMALAELGVDRDQVTVEVLSEGRSGIFGIRAEEARVRVTLQDDKVASSEAPQQDIAASAKEVLEKILDLLGLETEVEVHAPSPYGIEEGQVSCVLDIQGTEMGVLIGRRGKTLFALQYLVNLILSKRYRSRVKVFVDVEGYRRRRQDSLRALALRMAEQVLSSGQSVTLEAMPPHERRIVHLTLQSHPHVITESVGEGEDRKVIISPRATG
ncbi:MAG: RNA-binding cell elongation regulator Jag/EloR, partial [Dehalococcoidia bacterium]|nr:RNA-binding cell elongation regulator Jag/EloR [Dehalococcoidia bacterium]